MSFIQIQDERGLRILLNSLMREQDRYYNPEKHKFVLE